ncbi:tRNA-modifying protein YgfZ [Corallincola platygyrae]|uniref:tRNA-modifying protein YgfZ n=1 Tax=Corallincola platygyrae TaxID=1193278 RepID=A0ABW4XN49_9GAMM
MHTQITSLSNTDTTNLPALVVMSLELGVTQLSGEDRVSYLQGQTTCDVTLLSDSKPLRGAQCDAKGKMLSIFTLLKHKDSIVMLHSKESQQVALPELKKFAAFSKVKIEDAAAKWQMIGVAGKNATAAIESAFGKAPNDEAPMLSGEGFTILYQADPAPRFLVLLAASHAVPDALTEAEQDSPALWQLLDIEAGYPHLSTPLIQQYVPQMLNLQKLDAVSFSKGCYIGQETVARMKYLGKNKRAMYLLEGEFNNETQPGDNLELALGDNWRRSGVVVSAVTVDNFGKLLAVLPNDIEPDAKLRVSGQEQSSLTLGQQPYSLLEE